MRTATPDQRHQGILMQFPSPPLAGPVLSRRRLLTASAVTVAGAALGGCTGATSSLSPAAPSTSALPPANLQRAILAAEELRLRSGKTRSYTLMPRRTQIDLGGVVVSTLAYGDSVPGTPIRASVGDELSLTVKNMLADPTSLHSHGVAMRNDMDGVEPASRNIAAGGSFTYSYLVPHSGTFWVHPHVGIQTDYGLYAPIVFDDPKEKANYDTEWIVVLDDWIDGTGTNPKQVLADLQSAGHSMVSGGTAAATSGGMPGMTMGDSSSGGASSSMAMGGMGVGQSALLGGDAGDVKYPYYLINGRIPGAPTTFAAKPGQRVRIRIINAGADTAFRVALAGHQMTITHTDGFPVTPQKVDALLIGMAERYDVIVTLKDGVFPLVALAEGKNNLARALIRTGAGEAPPATLQPTELQGHLVQVPSLVGSPAAALPSGSPDIQLIAKLGGAMAPYRWTINDRTYEQTIPLQLREGQRGRLTLANNTDMWHPMHLHGHTFQVVRTDGQLGVRKDTIIVKPRTTMSVDLIADNPGVWMLHCHNGYHSEAGMMTRLQYTS